MNRELIDDLLSKFENRRPTQKQLSDAVRSMTPPPAKRVTDRTFAYSQRHRGQWFRPEYDFDEIQIAQDTDSYMFRAIQKKVNRVICAGMTFVGADENAVLYVNQRILHMSMATQKPFQQVVWDVFHDLFRYSNCMLAKKRDRNRSMGKVRKDFSGIEVDPVAGYFVLPFETLEFKTKANGDYKKVMQKMPDGRKKEFDPRDVVHFYTNKKPGFTVGTPELFPALDDIALLRRIEENVEDLIEANLFPVFHYKVGNDNFPERYGPDGTKESDVVKQTIEYMPAGGIYVSDHRHKIEAVGSEGRALRIDFYVNYFKNRALAALGTSAVDMGEGGAANRSTASTMSKGMIMDVEAMTCVVKQFIEFYIITELLLEGGFNPLDPQQMVHVKFGVIDKEERRADENQQIQLFNANLRTMQEVRSSLGDRPYTDEDYNDSYYKRFQEPLAMLKVMGGNPAAAMALGEHPVSNINSEEVRKAEETKAAATQERSEKNALENTVKNKAMPANQHGSRASAKTTEDILIADGNGELHVIPCDFYADPATISQWGEQVVSRYSDLSNNDISFTSVAKTMLWRLKDMNND